MTDLRDVLRRASADLRDEGSGFALVGGLAVSARTEPRFTRDVDLAVAVPGDPAAEELVTALGRRGWRIVTTLDQDAVGRLAAVRLVADQSSVHGIVVDLLFASSGIEPEIVAAAEPLEVIGGVRVPVATAGHLLVLKLLSRSEERPQDAVDVRALAGVLAPADEVVARDAAMLVQERGYARGRGLADELSAVLDAR